MKARKRKMMKLLLYYICVFAILFSMGITDYYRAVRQKDPIFSFREVMLKDGGTRYHYGLGYTVIHYNQMEEYGGRKDIEFRAGQPPWEDYGLYEAIITLALLALPVVFVLFRLLLRMI